MTAGKDRTTESQRILDRVDAEASRDAFGVASRTARRVGRHLSASDIEPEDRVELVGTRIGRVLGLLVTVGLVAMFVWLLTSGG